MVTTTELTARQRDAYKDFFAAFDHCGHATPDAIAVVQTVSDNVSGQAARKRLRAHVHMFDCFMRDCVEFNMRAMRFELTQDGARIRHQLGCTK